MKHAWVLLLIPGLLSLSCTLVTKDHDGSVQAPVIQKRQPAAARPVADEPEAREESEPATRAIDFGSTTTRSQKETNKEYGYAFDRGSAARIESAEARPRIAPPGKDIELVLTYAVLTHSAEPVEVREIREVWFKGALIERLEVETEKAGGTYRSVVPFSPAPDAKRGTYRVVCIVQTPSSRDLREALFEIRGPGKRSNQR